MRLIDADVLIKEALADGAYGYVSAEQIANAPTIDLSEQAKRDIATIIENEMDMRVLADRKHGKWMEENRRPKSSAFYCSLCKRTAYDPQNHRADVPKRCRYAYCPNCGARMDVE